MFILQILFCIFFTINNNRNNSCGQLIKSSEVLSQQKRGYTKPYSHSLPSIPTHSHLLLSTPTCSHLLSIRTHLHPLPSTPTDSYPLPLPLIFFNLNTHQFILLLFHVLFYYSIFSLPSSSNTNSLALTVF